MSSQQHRGVKDYWKTAAMKVYVAVIVVVASVISTCSASCYWGKWGPWGECSVTCGTGKRWRERDCEPAYQCDDDDCYGPNKESEICKEKPCCEAEWGPWGPWSGCKKCKKKEFRKRKCVWKGSYCTGKPKCKGKKKQKRPCPYHTGYWNPWGPWGPCTPTCDEGTRQRSRTCKCPPCKGPTKETEECPYLPPCPCDCWWSKWGDCYSTGGYPPKCERKRTCICRPPDCGDCDGPDKEPCYDC